MVERREVVQNPLLRLVRVPERERPDARGKTEERIVSRARYERNRRTLSDQFARLPRDLARRAADHAGRYLVFAAMHADSLASTHTPGDLFSSAFGAEMKMPWRDGYVVEVGDEAVARLGRCVEFPQTVPQRCDIYSVERVEVFAAVLADVEKIELAWTRATVDEEGLRYFDVRLANYGLEEARISVLGKLASLATDDALRIGDPVRRARDGVPTMQQRRGWLAPEEASVIVRRHQRLSLALREKDDLIDLVLTGSITRWEPVSSLRPTLPGAGAEPRLSLPEMADEPIVGVIDGGYHSSRYRCAVAWRHVPPLIDDHEAARNHGNKVASVVVDAHLWSNQLQLPQLVCRLGVVQAVPRWDLQVPMLNDQTLAHVEQAFATQPDTHVWNLSANLASECDDYEVSTLGHGLAKIARRHSKLLVISAGNREDGSLRISPPADCEAAIVVAGRTHDAGGAVGGACGVSRVGLGPEGMLKPETSWFSQQRVVGGEVLSGTSFAAPLVSRLAAHTWRHLAEPTPDMVKAVLISAADLNAYSHEMGFGSPIRPELPWNCASNAAIVAWSENLTYMQRYYWTGIRIPASLMENGRFRGRAKLVAILAPYVSMEGHHYFQTRIEAALSYRVQNKGEWETRNLAGCLNPLQGEVAARHDDNKWDPVRVYERDCRRTPGVAIPGSQPTFHVYARLFWRDTYRYSKEFMRDTPCVATFVVTLESRDEGADTYNEFRRIMAEDVVSAVVEQDIQVDLDDEI